VYYTHSTLYSPTIAHYPNVGICSVYHVHEYIGHILHTAAHASSYGDSVYAYTEHALAPPSSRLQRIDEDVAPSTYTPHPATPRHHTLTAVTPSAS